MTTYAPVSETGELGDTNYRPPPPRYASSMYSSGWRTLQRAQNLLVLTAVALGIAALAIVVQIKNQDHQLRQQVDQLTSGQSGSALSTRAERLGFDTYAQSVGSWVGWGGNDWNWRADLTTDKLTATNLQTNDVNINQVFATLGAGVSGTPTSTGDRYLYYTTWNGTVECIDRFTGTSLWSYNVQTYILANFQPMVTFDLLTSPVMGPYVCSRSAPRIDGSYVYITTLAGSYVFKFNRFTGAVIWIVQAQTHPYGILTAAPTVRNGKVCIGLASWEESAAFYIPNYVTTFRGGMQCLSKQNGAIVWTWNTLATSTVAKYPILTGGAVWGSEFPYDASRNWFYVATGNVYQQPDVVNNCIAKTVYDPHFAIYPTYKDPCRLSGDYSESVVALDADTGVMQWQSSRTPAESWTFVCGLKAFQAFIPVNTTSCPQIPGDDTDFGQQPMFLPISQTGMASDMLAVGQKSGIMWGLNANDGSVIWATITGPWGTVGGIHFGSATDGTRMFYANGNSGNISYSLVAPSPGYTTNPGYVTALNGVVFLQGHVGAIDVATGEILWQTPLPCELSGAASYAGGMVLIGCGAFGPGPAGPNEYNVGQFYMLNANTGEIIYHNRQLLGAQVNGPSIIGDMMYIPAGYTQNFGPRLPIPAIGGIYAMTITSERTPADEQAAALRQTQLGYSTYPETVTNWPSWGGNEWNWRAQLNTVNLTLENLVTGSKAVSTVFVSANYAVSGTPTTTGDQYLYFTTWNGTVECINRFTGAAVWTYSVRTYILATYTAMDLLTNAFMNVYICSRSAPLIDGSHIYIGSQAGAYAFKINRFTGVPVWIVQVQTHAYGTLTASPGMHAGRLFWGLTSWEEQTKLYYPTYTPTYQDGGVVCMDPATGAILWHWRTLTPPAIGYTGAGVWGSEFSYDASRGLLFAATGDAYTIPVSVEVCLAAHVYNPDLAAFPDYRDPCRERGIDYSESIVALNVTTGELVWASSRTPTESWTVACGLYLWAQTRVDPIPGVCYSYNYLIGDDVDFAQQPMFVPVAQSGLTFDIIVVGQKSGIVWGVKAADGSLVWATVTGPWGSVGGVHFGSATDGKRMFFTNGNSNNYTYTLTVPSYGYTTDPGFTPADGGKNMVQGNVGAIDISTGNILWQTPLPCELSGATTYAGGMVLLGCGAYKLGTGANIYNDASFYILSADTGQILYSTTTLLGGQGNGPSVVGDMIYLPTGYTSAFAGRANVPTVGHVYGLTVV